ncbi:3-deoxy-manno-octulosonate cytidylyltransferase [uncultured Desulfatiglans sp.]|uniref:3-deoxy-manno-octulosonate cytidylyltransferase n=1 Tax=Uncultured Desulfatiglans sp. TaxID=1748965 RepID=A0A653A2R7_UNCDX|nr:3-deoxy-manno-octulosonate cytidylyltransferase [uncultured Desulfatiglans sp.]
MDIYAFIPARYQSTRLPGKPLVLIAGKPMIQHVYERALRCTDLAGVYVATDDSRIADCVRSFEGRVVMTRTDHLSGTDRICEAATSLGVKDEDVIVNIQGDQPLFDPSVVADLVGPFKDDPVLSMSTLKFRINADEAGNPNHVKVVTDAAGFALYFSRAAIPFYREKDTPAVYYKHLGFYAYRMEFLRRFSRMPEGCLESAEKLEQLRVLENGVRMRVVETASDSPEVDVAMDVRRVEERLLAITRKGA